MADETAREYNCYFEQWLHGISSEVRFWDKLMATKGACLGADAEEIFSLRCSFDAPFALERDLEWKETNFLDIGSGPFSRCGVKTDKSILKIQAMDPLAAAYDMLKEKHGIATPIVPETGLVEIVDELYPEESFHIVHMSNALDHCFDPLTGIKKMLYITKTGGKLILRHNENEAEHAHYKGLHQWNIHLTKSGQFEIWRPDLSINVQRELAGYAVLEEAQMAEEQEHGSIWRHNRFVLRKTRPIPKVDGTPYGIIIKSLLDQLATLGCGNLQGT